MDLRNRLGMLPEPSEKLLTIGEGRPMFGFWHQEVLPHVFGRSFELVTDHKPLLELLGEARSTSPQALACVRRWSL